MQGSSTALSSYRQAFLSLIFLLGLQAFAVHAETHIIGVVIDYAPRNHAADKPLVAISRGNEKRPVKEHEIVYSGDRFVFSQEAGAKAYVKALINAQDEVTLTPAHNELPEASGSWLQSIAPQLIAAYRWVNAASGVDKAEPRNALSRGSEDDVSDLVVFPTAKGALTISGSSADPLWIGWNGGSPPFSVTLAMDGKILQSVDICKNGSDAACPRETQITTTHALPNSFMLSVTSADGASWSRKIEKAAIAPAPELGSKLGELGVFLSATDLLNRDADKYVLETARRLASISSTYPPARTLLDKLKNGRAP
jgi:hypothetical protein